MKILDDGDEGRLCPCLLETAVILVLTKKIIRLNIERCNKDSFGFSWRFMLVANSRITIKQII